MRSLWRALGMWFGKSGPYSEIEDEMALHIELRARKLQASGLSQEEAYETARKRFGNRLKIQEDCRSAFVARWWDELRQDTLYSCRLLRRNWVFALAAVSTLTLGIAANTAVFSFIDALILRPLPVPHPERLVLLTVHEWSEGQDISSFCYPVFEGVAKRVKSMEGLFTWNTTQFTLGWGPDAHTISGGVASGLYYQTLGVAPALGRFFGPADDSAEAAPVAVLSYQFWQHEFGGSSSVIGRKIRLDSHPFTVIGVEPSRFPVLQIGSKPEVTVPIHANAALHLRWDMLHSTNEWWLSVFGRLRPGVTLATANAEAAALTRPALDEIHFKLDDLDVGSFHARKPHQTLGVTSGVHGNREFVARFDKQLYVLICISLAVLGIGSLNIANLLLARAVARERELAVRLALGAGRMRIVRQMMTESLLLSAVGAVLGALTASSITHSAMALVVSTELVIDWRMLAFVAGLSCVVTMLFGIAPALRGVALGAAALKFGRVGQVLGSARLSQAMVCVQIALSLALISSAFLFSKSFRTLLAQDPGFTRKNLVFCGVDTERSGMNPVETAAFFERVLERLRSTPQMTSAALTGMVPLTGNYAWEDLSLKQYPRLSREQRQIYTHRVSPSYFRTMNIGLVAGRDFNPGDSVSKEQAGVISEKAARLYFPNQDAIGQTLNIGSTPVRIVGIAKDALYQDIRSAAPQTLYFDIFHTQGSQGGIVPGATSLLVRTTGSTALVASTVRQFIKETGRDVSVNSAMSFDQQAESLLVTEKLLALLASAFAAVGCLLAAIGLYGIIAYSVTRRTPEIGIRMALGANRGDVMRSVLEQAAKLAAIGIGAGAGIAVVSGRLISGMLFQTRLLDPMTSTATILVLLIIIAVAGLVPALRAARIDPVEALRWD